MRRGFVERANAFVSDFAERPVRFMMLGGAITILIMIILSTLTGCDTKEQQTDTREVRTTPTESRIKKPARRVIAPFFEDKGP